MFPTGLVAKAAGAGLIPRGLLSPIGGLSISCPVTKSNEFARLIFLNGGSGDVSESGGPPAEGFGCAFFRLMDLIQSDPDEPWLCDVEGIT
jgi:hypothetical protein